MSLISATKVIIIFIVSIVNISHADSNATYIEIDHGLVPREIKNINDMSPLPVPPGRNSAMKKYAVSKRPIQEIILEIDENKQSNNINIFQQPSIKESELWQNEGEIRTSKLKSVLGTNGEVYYDGDWGLMSAVLTCYNNHWVLKTGPEDWWTVVIRKIVQALDEHGEIPQVRDFFVEHKGKKKLDVVVGPTLSNINYNWLFSQFSNKIRENIKIPSYVDIIENDFSCSTDEQTMISHIMLMSSVKSYFEFGMSTMCGIPGIEMKGTEEDWVKLVDKIDRLETLLAPINKYLYLNNWFKTAKTVFSNLLNTYRGKPNIEWWGRILSWDEMWGSGMEPHWSGWFPKFVGAGYQPGKYLDFPSDLVTVPLHISDSNNLPQVEDDGILIAGIVGFNVEKGGRAPIVEPKHAWSLLLPEDSPVADRLTGKFTNPDSTSHQDVTRHRQPTDSIPKTPAETQMDGILDRSFIDNKLESKDFNISNATPVEKQIATAPSCRKCRINTKKLKMRKYCKSEYALIAQVINKEILGEYTRFNIQIMNIYKGSQEMNIQRGSNQLWVRTADLACECPNINIGKEFLIMGAKKMQKLQPMPGFSIDQKSLFIEWNHFQEKRIRRFVKKASKCGSSRPSRYAPILFPNTKK